MQEEQLRKQEESVAKQEALRRSTKLPVITVDSCLRCQSDAL